MINTMITMPATPTASPYAVAVSVQNESVLATAHRTADTSALFGTRGRIDAVKSAAPPRGEPR